MTWQEWAMAAAGGIGAVTAVVHGVLLQRYFITPMHARLVATGLMPGARGRMIAPLMHYSTGVWLTGGMLLICAAVAFDGEVQRVTALIVGVNFLVGAILNLAAIRAFHPGWALMAFASALIGAALVFP